jgi:hypothetical protein
MTFSLSMPADGVAVRPARVAACGWARTLVAFLARHWGAVAVIAFTLAVHVPSLGYFFDGDDFVVLGSVEYLGAREYIADSWRMDDIVASWRPLTAVVYAAEWELFGLNPLAWRLVNLSVHLASVTVLYVLVQRTTARPAAGALASLIFGVSGAHFDTVNYITALPHVLATFFVLSSLLATLNHASAARGSWLLYWLSFGLFLLAFLSNEGAFVYAPLIVAAHALFSGAWRRPLRLALHALPFAIVAASWVAFYDACTCDQLKIEEYGWGPHVWRNFGVYMSWLALPARQVPLSPDAVRWWIAAATAIVIALAALRGPQIARVGAAGVVFALVPFVPVEIWTASRYTYGAVAFFAPVAALIAVAAFDRMRALHQYSRTPSLILGMAFVGVIAALYAWQTHAQHQRSGDAGERWRLLATELRATYDDVPDGTTIYIIDGQWQNPMEQYAWVPSVARALYGDAAAFDLPRAAYETDPPDTRNALFLEWRGGRLHPVPASQVTRR